MQTPNHLRRLNAIADLEQRLIQTADRRHHVIAHIVTFDNDTLARSFVRPGLLENPGPVQCVVDPSLSDAQHLGPKLRLAADFRP